MNVFAFISLSSAMISFALGIFVFSKDTRNSENRLFMVFCLSFAYYAFTQFGARQAESEATAFFWFTINVIWPFLAVFLFHFGIVFTEKAKLLKNKAIYVLMYLPVAILVILILVFVPAGKPVRTYWGWTYSSMTVLHQILAIWSAILAFITLFIFLHFYLTVTDPRRKQQVKYVILGLSLIIVVGSFTGAILPLLSIRVPELIAPSFAILTISIGYAMLKHKLFILTPASAAESILATTSDCLLLIDPSGKILTINQATENFLGYKMSEVKDQPVGILFSDDVKNVLFKGKGCPEMWSLGSISDVETTFTTKKGRTIPISLSASAMRDSEGILQGIVLIGRDITERKHAEEALRESEELYKTLVKTSPDAVTVTDLEGHINEVSQRTLELHGYERAEELLGKSALELIAFEFHKEALINLQKTLEDGVTRNLEYTLVRKDDSHFIGELNASLLKDAHGNPKGFIATTRDITERKKLEDMRYQFINIAAHELRTPLSALKAHTDLLKIKVDLGHLSIPEEVNDRIEVITRNADRLAVLINNLLDYTRLEAGTIKLKLELDSLEAVVSQTIKEVLPLAQKYGHTLDFATQKTLPPIYMDKTMVSTIFTNLLSNAIKYTPDGGRIEVTMMEQEDNIHITLNDTGIGIAKEDLEKIFQPFFVTDISESVLKKSEFERTGLGLAITNEYVKMHGGSLWVESQIGKGSTFHILLPKKKTVNSGKRSNS